MTEPEPVKKPDDDRTMPGDSQPRGPWGDVSFRLVDDDEEEVSADARAGLVQEA